MSSLDAGAKRKHNKSSGSLYVRVDETVERELETPAAPGFLPVPPTTIAYVVGPIMIADNAKDRVDEFINRLNADDDDDDDDDDDEAWANFQEDIGEHVPIFSATTVVEAKYSIASQDDRQTLIVVMPEANMPAEEEAQRVLFVSSIDAESAEQTKLSAVVLVTDKGIFKQLATAFYMREISARLRASGIAVSQDQFSLYYTTKIYDLSKVDDADKYELGVWAAGLGVIRGGQFREFFDRAVPFSILVDARSDSVISSIDGN